MTLNEAKEIAAKVFPFTARFDKSPKGACRIWNEDKLLASTDSWRSALRYASPFLEAKQAEQNARAEARRTEERLAVVEANKFADFLREKFEADFEAWKAASNPEGADGPQPPPSDP